MRHKEEQRRAAAGLLIWSIVAQALLLLLFKALYSTTAGRHWRVMLLFSKLNAFGSATKKAS